MFVVFGRSSLETNLSVLSRHFGFVRFIVLHFVILEINDVSAIAYLLNSFPDLEQESLENKVVVVGRLRAIVLEVVEPPHHMGVNEREELNLERREDAGRVSRPPVRSPRYGARTTSPRSKASASSVDFGMKARKTTVPDEYIKTLPAIYAAEQRRTEG